MSLDYTVIRSDRKTISIEIRPDGQVVVRCPKQMKTGELSRFVQSRAAWIEKHLRTLPEPAQPLSDTEVELLRAKTRQLVSARAEYYASRIGVDYRRISVRTQRTRWGSCSSRGNLNFNCLLALMPPEVADYVVVHELCHRKHMDHSSLFWAEVERILPDYKEYRLWLRKNGNTLMARLTHDG